MMCLGSVVFFAGWCRALLRLLLWCAVACMMCALWEIYWHFWL